MYLSETDVQVGRRQRRPRFISPYLGEQPEEGLLRSGRRIKMDVQTNERLGQDVTTNDVIRAVRMNREYASSLGWQAHFDRIVRLLGFTTYTPDEQTFAEAVARWQQRQGLTADGVIGPNTWSWLRAAIGAEPAPATPTLAPSRPSASSPVAGPSFVTINPYAKITPPIERVVNELEAYFRRGGLRVQLTSGYRSPQDQLELIKRKAIQYGLEQRYPSIRTATLADVESWRGAWDELLNTYRYIVNPPVPTVSRLGRRAGKRIGASPHTTGKAFDLSTGNRSDLEHIAAIVQRYQQEGGSIQQILIEAVNNAVHVGLQ